MKKKKEQGGRRSKETNTSIFSLCCHSSMGIIVYDNAFHSIRSADDTQTFVPVLIASYLNRPPALAPYHSPILAPYSHPTLGPHPLAIPIPWDPSFAAYPRRVRPSQTDLVCLLSLSEQFIFSACFAREWQRGEWWLWRLVRLRCPCRLWRR